MGEDCDKLSAKIGIFGKSFNQMFQDIQNAKINIQYTKALENFKKDFSLGGLSFKQAFNANGLSNAPKEIQELSAQYVKLTNRQRIYYRQLQTGKITQEQYDAAMTASNAKMKALTNQANELANAQRNSTVASNLAVGALKLIGNVAISYGISLIISLIYKAVNSQKELREAAVESANSIEDQTKSMNDLISQYKAIVDSEKTEAEKTAELNEWKQTLAETYKNEKINLEELNLEREKGIKLLNDELEAANNKSRSLWLVDNAEQFAKAKEQIENGWSPLVNSNSDLLNGSISSDFFNRINEKDIRDSIKGKFNKVYDLGKSTVFDFQGKDLIETYDNLQEILSKFANAKNLTVSENILLEKLKKEEKALKKVLDDYQQIYNIGYSYTASTQFTEYTQNNPLKNVGRKSYIAWRDGLLATADGDKKLEDELLILAEQQFPDYTKYFENLESAKQKFTAYEGTNKFNFLAGLSPEDLETALKIPDLFRNGLDGAAKLIEEFNKKHPIELDVDTESIDEIADKLANKTKLIKSAMTDMRDNGYISSATYAELVKEGGNFTECLEVQNGKLVLNIQKLKELEAQEYDNAIAANELAIAEMQASINSAYDYQRLQGKINELKEQKAFYLTAKEEILRVKPDDNNGGSGGSSSSEEPTKVTDFKKELAEKQHLVAMKELSEEDYLNWLDDAYKKAYAGLKDYDDDLYKYEEEIFSKRRELAEKTFNDINESIEKEIESLEKLKENATLEADADGNIYSIIDQQIELYKQEAENIKKRIAELEASGLIGVEDEIEELNTKREDLLDKIYDLSKERTSTGIENEISYWEKMQSKQNDFYDKQIEQLKKQKELLEDKNDEEERAKDLAEKQLNLRKAEIALDDARRNRNVLVISEGGAYSYEADKTAIAEAEQDVKKAEEDLAKTEKDILKDGIDKQIDILEEQKDKDSEYYDTVVKLLEDMSGKNKVQSESNLAIWDQLLATDAGQNAVAQIDPEILSGLLDSGFLVKNNGRFEIGGSSQLPVVSAADVIAFVGKVIGETSKFSSVSGYDQTSLNVQAAANERNGIVKSSVFNNSNVSQISIQKVDVAYSGNSMEDFYTALVGAAGNKVLTLTNQIVSGTT